MFKVKNWEKFQHYKPKFASKGEPVKPVWIKFYFSLLDDFIFHSLPLEARAVLPLLWLMASENNGIIPDPDQIAFRLRLTVKELDVALKSLISKGFLESLDLFYNDSIREEKRERIEERRIESKKDFVFAETKTENKENSVKVKKSGRLKSYLDERTEAAVSQEWGEWSLGIGMGEMEINEQMHIFCDYWNAAAGQKGVKADWTATWRNWCRKALQQRKEKEIKNGLFQQRYTQPYKK